MRRIPTAGPILVLVGQHFGASPAVAATTSTSHAPTTVAATDNTSTPSNPREVAKASEAAPTILIEVRGGAVELQPEEIRVAVEAELGLPVTSDRTKAYVGVVTIEGLPGAAVKVRYVSKDESTKLERRVALPVDRRRRATVVAWVVGNLVRNEAAELLSGMVKRVDGSTFESNASDPPAAGESGDSTPNLATADPSASTTETSAPANAEPRTASSARISVVRLTGSVEPAVTARLPSRAWNLALYWPRVALHSDADRTRYRLSLGGAYSRIGALDGVGVTLLVDRIEQRARGAVVSGLWSRTGEVAGFVAAGIGSDAEGDLLGTEVTGILMVRRGCVVGAQLTGAWATTASCRRSKNPRAASRALEGLQVAGLYAGAYGGIYGVQVGGAAALGQERIDGAQISGGMVYTKGDGNGVQLAGLGNVGRANWRGTQVAGGFNFVAGDLVGVQVAGGFNHAQDVRGAQVGLTNVARDVSGLQVGFVNLSQKNSGFALGLFNWTDGARIRPTYFFQTPGLHSVGYRNSAGHSSSSVSFGYDPMEDIARTHFAVGARSAVGRFSTGLEFGYGWVLENFSAGPRRDRAHELDLIATATLELLPEVVSVFGGGGIALPVAGLVAIEPRGLAQAGLSFL